MSASRQHDGVDGAVLMQRIEALAAISESAHGLTRRYLTPEHRRANDLVAGWMREAGMSAHEDAVGNVVGRYEAERAGAPALMIGSHLDTVTMAGRYDGMLGVVAGLAVVETLSRERTRLPFAVEVIGFADEEGVRFGSTFLGSRAVAGTFEAALLEREDGDGVSMADALREFGLDPARVGEAARRPADVLAYLEVHIEQGPVLEAAGLPVGTVTAIAGASRLALTIHGVAGHAGTVPMAMRRDALAAASECVLAAESAARDGDRVVATVGRLVVSPGALNVIPGEVTFTLDVRAATDAAREQAVAHLEETFAAIAARRGVELEVRRVHDAPNVDCAPRLMDCIDRAIEAQGLRALRLPSGAGHDGSAMAAIADIGMLFVRCEGGISHNPAEAASAEDAAFATRVLLHAVRNFDPASPGAASDPESRERR